MANTEELPEVQSLSYEQARDELVQVVARIESGDVPLEQAMELWQRGEALAEHCQGKLDQAQQRLDDTSLDAEATRPDDQDDPSDPDDPDA